MTKTLKSLLFTGPWGHNALVYSELGLAGLFLARPSIKGLEKELRTKFPNLNQQQSITSKAAVQVPLKLNQWPWQELAERLQLHMSGTPQKYIDVPLDYSVCTDFQKKVYEKLKTIKTGHTVTYSELANAIGMPGAARAIGMAMGKNPWPLVVPCHRVCAAGGKLGGFSFPGELSSKRRLINMEGVHF